MTKIMAKVLSVIMLISAITTNLYINNVYADGINYQILFTKALAEGTTNSVPTTTTTLGDDAAWFEWDMNNYEGSGFATGKFELRYPVRNGEEVVFSINKTEDNKAYVTYKIVQAGTNTPVATSNYTIYSHRVNNYVSLATYISSGYNSSEDFFQVLNNVDVDGNTVAYPSFIVGQDRGFSFKYNNATIHFRWDQATNKMYFYTDKIQKGYIIEPTLSIKVDGYEEEIFNKKVSTGISKASFSSKPFANEDMFVEDTVEIDGVSPDDLFPANDSEDKGLVLTFDALKTWDDSSKTFLNTATDYKVPVQIRMYALDDSDSIQIDIPDTNTTVTPSDITISPSGGATVKSVITSGSSIAITLGNLDSGIIYDPTNISVLPDTSEPAGERLVSNVTNIDFGEVFTFPKYEIISQNNKLYLVVQPFSGYKGEFLLKTGITQEVSSRQQSDGSSQSTFPLAINAQSKMSEYFQLFFSPGKVFENTSSVNTENNIHSQQLYYKPVDDSNAITIPNNFYVVDYNHIKDDTVSDYSKGFLEVTLRWDIGLKDKIDAMMTSGSAININYELSNTLTPDSDNINKISDINVKLEKNADGTIYATYTGGDGGLTENYVANYVVKEGTKTLEHKFQADSAANVYYAETTLLFKTAVTDYSGSDINEIYFRYPNIYFLTIQPTLYDGEDSDSSYEDDLNISGSVLKSITLDYLEESTLNPPQNLLLTDNTYTSISNGDSKDEVSFEVDFALSGQSFKEYFTGLYNSDIISEILAGTYEIDSYFNIYITEIEELLTDDFVDYDYDEKANNSSTTIYQDSYNNTVNLSSASTTDGSTAITKLRNGKVVKIAKYPITDEVLKAVLNFANGKSYALTLAGLDTNTKYYVAVDLVVEDLEKSPTTLDYSDMTPIKAITTKGPTTEVQPGENDPNAPEIYEIETSKDTTILGWNKIAAEEDEDVDIEVEYELLRLKDNVWEDKYLDTKDNFDTTWESYTSSYDRQGFRTDGNNILIYSNSDFVASDESLYQYNAESDEITFTDKTLVPNSIYYYYIRTVKIIDGKELYSVWERVSVTTSNLEGPINLVALFEEYDSKINLESEVYLQFEAPIKDVTQLGSIFNIELQMKKENDDWGTPVVLNPNSLIIGETIDENGYRQFVYKVTGLEPGTSYTFRVRLTLVGENSSSLYSNEVRVRTEGNQDDYDEEDEINDWTDYINDKLEGILNGNFWEISDTTGKKEILYREDKFDGLLKVVNDGFMTLESGDKNKYNHYYIPVNSLIKANNQKIGFKIKVGDETITLSSGMIDPSLNNALKPLAQSIKDGNIKDYYLDIVVKTDDTVTKINNTSISAPLIEVNVVTKAFTPLIEEFEIDVYGTLATSFLDEGISTDAREEIEQLIEDEASNEEIIKKLDSEIQKYAANALEDIKEMFDENSAAEKYNAKVTTFDTPLIISTPTESTESITKGLKQVGTTWIDTNTTNFGNEDMLVTYEGGVYTFTSTQISISNIGNVEDATKAHEVIVKYDLYDILKDTNGINATKLVTRYEAYASFAKILGNSSADPAIYLNSLGMDVSTRNLTNPLKQEELVYLIMKVYEYNTKTSIDSYQIKNFAKMATIQNVSSNYLKSVQVAVDLGIIDLSTFSPSAEVTTEVFLDTILKVGNKVGI